MLGARAKVNQCSEQLAFESTRAIGVARRALGRVGAREHGCIVGAQYLLQSQPYVSLSVVHVGSRSNAFKAATSARASASART